MTDPSTPHPPHNRADTAAPDNIDPELLDLLLDVWCYGWASGATSWAGTTAVRGGLPPALVESMVSQARHQSIHAVRDVMNDPLARHTVVAAIHGVRQRRAENPGQLPTMRCTDDVTGDVRRPTDPRSSDD